MAQAHIQRLPPHESSLQKKGTGYFFFTKIRVKKGLKSSLSPFSPF